MNLSARFAGRLVVLVALAGGLAACTSLQRNKYEDVPCPRIATIANADKITQFREGAGRDLTDVEYTAAIVDQIATCYYEDNAAEVSLRLGFQIARGPADDDRVANIDYWVAVLNPQGDIMGRQRFNSAYEFRNNRTQLVAVEELTQRIPLDDPKNGVNYRVIFGFILTPEELEYNKRALR
jgi:hypothetical protein